MNKELLFGNKKGQTVVEMLIGIALLVLGISFSIVLVFGGQKILIDRENGVAARALANEGLDAVVSINERSWSELVPGEHGLSFATGSWVFVGGSDTLNNLTRKIKISTVDADTKKIESEVSWQTDPLRIQKVSLVTLLTNWKGASAPPDPGDTGGSGISGDWQHPRTLGSLDLGPGNEATGLDVINKIVYLGATAASGNKPDFYVVNATNGNAPFVVSSLETGPGINALDVSGSYAFVATKNTDGQLQIIDITNLSSTTLKKTFKLPGVTNAQGSSIFYANSKVYVGTPKAVGPELFVIDVSNPLNPVSLGSKEVNADVNDIYVQGDFAYVANSENEELTIFNISNPANIVRIGGINLSGDNEDGKSIFKYGSVIYMGRTKGGSNNTANHEFNIIEAASSTNLALIGSKDIAYDVNDIRTNVNLAFVGTSNPNEEFQVWNISNPSSPVLWSSFNFAQVATGIDYEDNLVYVSVRSNDALRIITSGQ